MYEPIDIAQKFRDAVYISPGLQIKLEVRRVVAELTNPYATMAEMIEICEEIERDAARLFDRLLDAGRATLTHETLILFQFTAEASFRHACETRLIPID